MKTRYFTDTRSLISALLASWKPGDLILTPSRRLAHFIRHTQRLARIQRGCEAWVPVDALSVSAWFNTLSLYLENVPRLANQCFRWKVLKEVVEEINPPEPFTPGLELVKYLDDAYSILLRNLVPWDSTLVDHPLFVWRNEVLKRFEGRFLEEGLTHPERLPDHILRSSDVIGHLPRTLHVVLLDTLAPSEAKVLNAFQREIPVISWNITNDLIDLVRNQGQVGSSTEWVALPDPTAEMEWVVEELLEGSKKWPLHDLGVVLMSPGEQVLLMRDLLEEILGPGASDGASSYNIAYGFSLAETSLFKALMLPLRFWIEDEPRALFGSFLMSTYYGIWSGKRDEISSVDFKLRKLNKHRKIHKVLADIVKNRELESSLMISAWFDKFQGLRRFEGTIGEWVSHLRNFWEATGFPVLASEEDELAWRHVNELLDMLRTDLGTDRFSVGEFTDWVTAAAFETTLSPGGYEEAGIQILGLLEARGLCFERLWVVGLTARTLPQPVREIPLLSRSESVGVQGGTTESQWDFALKLFPKIISAAPHITFTRHIQENLEPIGISPFWSTTERRENSDIWADRSGWWARSPIYGGVIRGRREDLKQRGTGTPSEHIPGAFPREELSVSELESLLMCPFRFLAKDLLAIEPLEEEALGLVPRERGALIHRVLERFVKRVTGKNIAIESEVARELLVNVCNDVMAPFSGNPFYLLELRRWTDEKTGLLLRWLEMERDRIKKGNIWLAAESSFRGLRLSGVPFKLKGRIDRVDISRDGRLICLEYKTGIVPSSKEIFEYGTRPQLPVYTLALKSGLNEEARQHNALSCQANGNSVGAGYISLKKAGEVNVKEIFPRDETWGSFCERWIWMLKERISPVLSGTYCADPRPTPEKASSATPCRYCEYKLLCNRNARPVEKD